MHCGPEPKLLGLLVFRCHALRRRKCRRLSLQLSNQIRLAILGVAFIVPLVVPTTVRAQESSPQSQGDDGSAKVASKADAGPATTASPNAESSANSAGAHGTKVEEIIVTANFRESSAQDVAGSLITFSEARFKELGISDVKALTRYTPSLANNDRGAGRNELSIRGIGRTGIGASLGPSPTGLYMDDISINTFGTNFNTGQADIDYNGIQRVEVLMGPQSTLYGESSEGGAIKYVTADPPLSKTTGSLEAGAMRPYGGYVSPWYVGCGSAVLSENVAGLSFCGGRRSNSGFIDATTDQKEDVNDSHSDHERVVLLVRPSEAFKARVALHHQTLAVGAAQNTTGNPEGLENDHRVAFDWTHNQILLVPLKLSYNFGPFAIESISGYYHSTNHSWSWSSIAATFASIATLSSVRGQFADGHALADNIYRQRSQEIRLISSEEWPITYIAGGYYRHGYSQNDFYLRSYDLPSNFNTSTSSSHGGTTNVSFFGEIAWKPVPEWTGTIGLRRFRENSKPVQDPSTLFEIPLPGNETQLVHKTWLPMARLEYRPNDWGLYYFRYATGTRFGGTNVPLDADAAVLVNPTPNIDLYKAYQPDKIKTYELGAKLQLLDGSLIVNSAAFYNVWDNLQVPVSNPFLNVTNAGGAEGYGAEINAIWGATDNLSLFLGATGGPTKLTEGFVAAPPSALNSFQENFVPAGTRIPYAKKFSAAGGVDYTGTFGSGWTFTSNISYAYTGSYIQEMITPGGDPVKGYGILDVGASVKVTDWTLSFRASNALNKILAVANFRGTQAYENLTHLPAPPGQSLDEDYINSPRVLKLTIGYQFED